MYTQPLMAAQLESFLTVCCKAAQRLLHLSQQAVLQAFVYLAGLQLLASSSLRSALAGSCGLIAGLAYQYNFFGIKRLKVASAHLHISPQLVVLHISILRPSSDLAHDQYGYCPNQPQCVAMLPCFVTTLLFS